jgi:uncharacterized protein (TIGR00730 family)
VSPHRAGLRFIKQNTAIGQSRIPVKIPTLPEFTPKFPPNVDWLIAGMGELEVKNDRIFLQGPRSRFSELVMLMWVVWDFIRGFRKLHFAGPCVTVFGSARFKEDHPEYQRAVAMGRELTKIGFTVMTGGGPGIMEAANRGAYEAGGHSIGCNIVLPFEQKENPYLHRSVTMNYFFVRKVLLVKYSYAFVVCPGGFGTMDEMFESLTLIQTGKIKDFPVVLLGKDYWRDLLEFMDEMKAAGTINAEDLDLLFVTDSVEDAATFIKEKSIAKFGLTQTRKKPRWWLGERGFAT